MEMNDKKGYFPIFINLENKKIIVVGGGMVACRKISTLLSFTRHISIYSRQLCDTLQDYTAAYPCVVWEGKNPTEEQICQADFVIAATSDRQENARIAAICHREGIMVNVADAKEECSFYFPAVVTRGELTVGISTGGNSPAFCKKVRQDIDEWLPKDYSIEGQEGTDRWKEK